MFGEILQKSIYFPPMSCPAFCNLYIFKDFSTTSPKFTWVCQQMYRFVLSLQYHIPCSPFLHFLCHYQVLQRSTTTYLARSYSLEELRGRNWERGCSAVPMFHSDKAVTLNITGWPVLTRGHANKDHAFQCIKTN